MKLIEVEKCGMIYLDHTYNLTIHEAETHLIIGANGQGKSTLIAYYGLYEAGFWSS